MSAGGSRDHDPPEGLVATAGPGPVLVPVPVSVSVPGRSLGPSGSASVRHTLLVVVGGQLERVLGTLNALALRWWLAPELLGIYTGLRLYLDNTNHSSLGISQGAVQEAPILNARGEADRADHLIQVAFSANVLTSAVYACGLLGYVAWRAPVLWSAPLGGYWCVGLVMMALLAPAVRYQNFLIAVLRSRQRFWLITQLQVLDTLVLTLLLIGGLLLWGFWGVLPALVLLTIFNVAYLHAYDPLRFRWVWDWPTLKHLLRVGLPIWVNALLFTLVTSMDRILLFRLAEQPEKMAGLYTIALMGTSWGLDLAGRIILVMYTYFQTTLGQARDASAVAWQALRVTEAQAPVLLAGSAVAYVAGPTFLGWIMPGYEAGLPAIRPLLPGMIALGLTLVSRQVLVTLNLTMRLSVITALGLMLTALLGAVGLRSHGLVGIAWGISLGYGILYIISELATFVPILGWSDYARHSLRLMGMVGYYALGAGLAAYVPLPAGPAWQEFALRCGALAVWGLPALWRWAQYHHWGGFRLRGQGPAAGV